MSTQHTAGEWKVADTFHDDGEPYAILGNESPVRGLGVREGTTISEHVAIVDKERDAHLIAAAPDLLAACEALLGTFSHIPDHWLSEECEGWPNSLFEKARAAIARARGEKGEQTK